jgi:glycerol-3-phosphate cytidylyltransferase
MLIKGFTCGAFDFLHPGHIYLLERSRANCDYLIVGLHIDPSIERPEKNKPAQSSTERYLQLKSLKYVDEVIPYDTESDLINLLTILDIEKRFIGTDYINKFITGEDVCNNLGIELCFVKRLHNWSSTNLRERLKNNTL